jgi:hypothetical protein
MQEQQVLQRQYYSSSSKKLFISYLIDMNTNWVAKCPPIACLMRSPKYCHYISVLDFSLAEDEK